MTFRPRAATKRILCFAAALFLCLAPVSLTAGPAYADDGTGPLGLSEISTDNGFALALADPLITTIRLTANVNASAVDWRALQNGAKTIVGAQGTERLILPALVYANGPLSFDRLTLARGFQAGTTIYANSHPFRFGPALTVEDSVIPALFGGGYQAATENADIVLESGNVGAVYCGANRGALTGTAGVTLHGAASVGGVYGAYENASIAGEKTLTLVGFGSADGYRQLLPAIYGIDELVLDTSFLRVQGWPAALAAGRMTVPRGSGLWLDGSAALAVPIRGEGGGLVVTAGSAVSLPDPAFRPDFITGRLTLSLSGGISATIINGGAYRDCFIVPEDMHTGTGADLALRQLFLDRIELISEPARSAYFLGDALETAGGVIRAYYTPAELSVARDIPVTTDMVSGFDPRRLGRQTLTVTYRGKTCTYGVWVADPAVAKLGIEAVPAKTSYRVGDSLNVSGGKVLVRYNNGAVYHIPFSDPSVAVNGFDSSAPGRLSLGVSYNGQSAGHYQVTVHAGSNRSDEDRGSGGTDIPDSERIVAIKGLPAGNTVKVGDRFTLSASPNRRGDWDWNEDYFAGKVDSNLNTLALEAIKQGSSRIAYSDGTAAASELVRIRAMDPEPEIVEPSEAEPQRIEFPAQASPPAAAVQEAAEKEDAGEESQSRREPVSEPDPAPVASKPEELAPLPEPESGEDGGGLFGGRTERIPAVVAGIVASVAILAAAGVGIWKFAGRP